MGRQPGSAFLASMYLLNARTLQRMADSLKGDDKARERVRFAVQQWVDAASPANFLALNPEVQKKAVDTRGESLTQGMQLLLNDLKQGHMSLTDESVFEVGRNVATTEGSGRLRKPLLPTDRVQAADRQGPRVPFIFVPPAINKFYILICSPTTHWCATSCRKGIACSWSVGSTRTTPRPSALGMTTLKKASSRPSTPHVKSPGLTRSTPWASAWAAPCWPPHWPLAGRGEKPAASLTLLTTFLDFTETGTLDIFIDEAMVQMREMTIGTLSPQQGGLMRGNELAATFSFLRANDLVWNYVVGNYLKGETLRHSTSCTGTATAPTCQAPCTPGTCATPISKTSCVSLERSPCVANRSTCACSICPPSCMPLAKTTSCLGKAPTVRPRFSRGRSFVLGASGHIAGVINPQQEQAQLLDRRQTACHLGRVVRAFHRKPGSWWPTWAKWLEGQAGGMVPAPKTQGSRQHPVIEAAPGRYVQRKS